MQNKRKKILAYGLGGTITAYLLDFLINNITRSSMTRVFTNVNFLNTVDLFITFFMLLILFVFGISIFNSFIDFLENNFKRK